MDLKTIYMKKRYEAPAAALIYLIVVPEERWSLKKKIILRIKGQAFSEADKSLSLWMKSAQNHNPQTVNKGH